MSGDTIQFTFAGDVSMAEVEQTLQLATLACEALHGPVRMSLEAASDVDVDRRQVSLAVGTPCGRDLATLFLGFVRREFGSASVTFTPGRSERS